MFAGQLSGVEGYTESIATGLLAGIYAAALARGEEPAPAPRACALGSLVHYITHADPKNFQPANITFDLLEPLEEEVRKKVRDKKERHRMSASVRWRRSMRGGLACRLVLPFCRGGREMVKDNFRIAYDPIGSHVYSQHDGISTRKFRLQAASLRAAIDCAHLGNHYCRRKRNVVIAQKCRCQILGPVMIGTYPQERKIPDSTDAGLFSLGLDSE